MQPFSSPRLPAFLTLMRDFQKALLPRATSLLRSFEPPAELPDASFQFALGSSSHPHLARAVVECITQIKAQLGPWRAPDLCQLFVTSGAYSGDHIRFAPSYVQECLSGVLREPPVVIGGVVQSLMGSGDHSKHRQGVSLMAASLPNVKLFPFHAGDASLPHLPEGSWKELIAPAEDAGTPVRTAGILLAEPHFVLVEDLLRRLRGVLPEAPLIGGVTQPAAWGEGRSLRGAVFLNSTTHDEGAVGCLMRGPLRMDQLCWQGCRPVSEVLRVTGARGNSVTHLDGLPALAVLRRLFTAMDDADRLLPLQIGLDAVGDGAFVARNLGGYDPGAMSFTVSSADVAEGSHLQLHVRDSQWAQKGFAKLLQEYAGCLPHEAAASPGSLGAWLYSCSGVNHAEEAALRVNLPGLKVQGARCNSEISQWGSNPTRPTLLSFSSAVGVLQHSATK